MLAFAIKLLNLYQHISLHLNSLTHNQTHYYPFQFLIIIIIFNFILIGLTIFIFIDNFHIFIKIFNYQLIALIKLSLETLIIDVHLNMISQINSINYFLYVFKIKLYQKDWLL